MFVGNGLNRWYYLLIIYYFILMNKKIIFLIIALFLCCIVVAGGAAAAYWWFSQAPQRALAASQEASKNITSAEFEFSMTADFSATVSGETEAGDLSLTGTGVMDMENEDFDLSMTVDSSLFTSYGLNTGMDIRMVKVGDEAYSYNGLLDSWSETDVTSFEGLIQDSESDSDSSDSTINPEGLMTYEYVGEESVKGSAVYTFSFTVDSNKLIDYMKAEMAKSAEDSDALSEMFSNIEISNIEGTYRIYKDSNLPAQADLTFDMSADMDGDVLTISNAQITVTMFNYNKAVDIVIPDEAREDSSTYNFDSLDWSF